MKSKFYRKKKNLLNLINKMYIFRTLNYFFMINIFRKKIFFYIITNIIKTL